MSTPHLSPAVKLDNMVYVSGQLPFMADGTLPDGIAAQTRQALANLEAVLRSFDLDLHSIVKTGVFVTRAQDFDGFATV